MITNPQLPPLNGYIEVECPYGRVYRSVDTGILFYPNMEPVNPDDPDVLSIQKTNRIQQSKADLASYLEAHPLLWADGKYYSITSEKQQWLTSKLFSAAAAKAAGEEYPLTWNDTEEVCRAWTYEDLWALARVIDARVTALVTYQQTQELAIRNAATQEELDAITVDYDTVPAPQLPEANP